MRPDLSFADQARVIAVRLRLGLTDLGAIEVWARGWVLAGAAAREVANLQVAGEAGGRIAARLLLQLGGRAGPYDVLRALASVRAEALTPEALSSLAAALEPVLAELAREEIPDELAPAFRLVADLRSAPPGGERALAASAKMRAFLLSLREKAGEPNEDILSLPAAAAPRTVCAIVVSYQTGRVLFDCLGALHADPAIDEIVLVDNGNPTAIIEEVRTLYGASPRLRITGGGVNRGFAAGVNLGAACSASDYLLIINPDAVLQPGSVAALEAAIRGAAEPVVVGGKIFGEDGREQRGGRRRRLTMRSAGATFLGLGWLKTINPEFVTINRHDEPEPAGPVLMEAVSGALMFLSRSGFERLGGFDEGYFLHVEDLDLCRRAEEEGGTVLYTPLASALHLGASSNAPARVVERHKADGFNRYFRKFAETPGEKLAARVLGPLIAILFSIRARIRGSRA